MPFALPTRRTRAERLRTVLHVLYLIFNEGYTSSEGAELQRDGSGGRSDPADALCSQAAARRLRSGGPAGADAADRRAARGADRARRRTDSAHQQDRTLWDQDEIAEGVALISATLPKGQVGPYQLQAAIAAVHDEAASAEETDWPQILALYELLKRMSDNPMVVLNHAIAAAMVHGPAKGLELLDALAGRTGRSSSPRRGARAPAGNGGRLRGAIAHYRLAAERTTNLPERNYLITQAARLQEG